MTDAVARWIFPVALVVAAATWVKGYAAVGDGFSAGAIAGLGGVAQYVCRGHESASRTVGGRYAWTLMALGLLLSLGVLIGPVFAGIAPVTHWPPPGAHVIRLGVLELHTAAVVDLGVAVLVYGALIATFDRLFPPFEGDMP